MLILIILIAAILGSFISFLTYRIMHKKTIFDLHSRCVNCWQKLSAKNLVPIVSYLLQKGKCNLCQCEIHKRYIIIELITVFSFCIIYMNFGLNMLGFLISNISLTLIVMSVIDSEHKIIPDSMQVWLFIESFLYHKLTLNNHDYKVNIIIGIALATLIYIISKIVGYIKKKEALGFGDVKLLFVIGTYLSPVKIVSFLFMSGILGIILSILWKKYKHEDEFPFGPVLCVSFFFSII